MRRKRFQKGSVRPRKHGRTKVWVAQWSENGGNRSKVLGRFADLSKSQAETMLAQILQPLNDKAGYHAAERSTRLAVRNRRHSCPRAGTNGRNRPKHLGGGHHAIPRSCF